MKRTTIINSKRTVIRIAPAPVGRIKPEWLYNHFPYGDKFNVNTHVFSYDVYKSVVFMAALPLELARAAYAEDEKVKVIDVYERRLFKKYCKPGVNTWVCFPQDGGWRVLDIREGLPHGAYRISDHPDYREEELKRLGAPPRQINCLAACGWLRDYFSKRECHYVEQV